MKLKPRLLSDSEKVFITLCSKDTDVDTARRPFSLPGSDIYKGNTEYKTNDLHQGLYGDCMEEMIQARNITEGSDSVK